MKSFSGKMVAAILAAAICALTGCSATTDSGTAATSSTQAASTASGSKSTSDASTIQIELTTAPVGLHPLKTNDAPSQYINNEIYETLYKRSTDGKSYTPCLAESLPKFSADGLTATIPLRKGVTFQDGTTFTSADVGYMIDSLKNKSYGSQRPSIVTSITSYECPDANTIVLHLAYNDGVLVAKLAHSNGAIVNSKLEKSGQDFLSNAKGAGTGAYQYESSAAGSSYTLEAYDGYWGGAPKIKKAVYSVVSDESTAVARLQTGEADFDPICSSDSYKALSAISGYTTANETSSVCYYLACRSNKSASNTLMENADFRKVLLESLDWKTYCDTMLNGLASYTKSIVGPTLVGYTDAMESAGTDYNTEDAKALVAKNGWSGKKVTLLVSTREWMQNAGAYIQAELAKVGITVTIKSEEWATYLADAKKDNYCDLCILSWSNVTGDGQQMLEPNFSTTDGQRVKYNNADFDKMVEQSAETSVLADRQKYMLEAVQKIQGDKIVAPMYSPNQIYCYNSTKYSNVVMDKGGEFLLKDFTING